MCKPNKSKELPIEILRELLSYDPETGELTWKPRGRKWFKSDWSAKSWNSRFAGAPASSAHNAGYRAIKILSNLYVAHRVAWAMSYNEWPRKTIDHVNGDRSDNRVVNLRSVAHQENHRNRAIPKSNTSGVMGVYWGKRDRKWYAQIKINGKKKHLGSFSCKKKAIQARKKAEIDYGFHANHGRDSISEQSVLV